MKITVKDIGGKSQGEVDVTFALVEGGRATQAVHDTVTAYRANQRSGTACTKTMGDVAGSGKKPWRQKGTGRARAGSFASPLWRGGGVVFGPKPRDFGKKVSRKTKKLSLRKALTERIAAGDVLIVGCLKMASPKTKSIVEILGKLGVEKSVVIVAPEFDANVRRASRNVQRVELTSSADLNSYQILRGDKILFTREGFSKLEERLKD